MIRRVGLLALWLAACGKSTPAECPGNTTCERCVADTACEWCVETAQCLAVGGTCSGDIARTIDQCVAAPETADAAPAAQNLAGGR